MKNILIVDDEYLIRFTLLETLKHIGEITTVATGNDALREIKEGGYDLCFLDLHLPDLNGLDILKTIQTVSPETGIIIMTGYAITDEVKKSFQAQGCGFIPKPFDLDEVMSLANRFLEKAWSRGKRLREETL